MSQTTGEELLNRINATLGVLQDAQEEAVDAVRDVATHKADPNAHGAIIAAAVEAAVSEALGGASGGDSAGEDGEDGEQLVERLSALEGRFDGSGKVLAANLPLSDAVNSATGTLAASDTAVKTAYDKAVAAANMAATCIHNTRLVLTESDAAWTSPVTGWARVTVIGGGGGGAGGYGDGGGTASSGGGGDSGEYAVHFVHLQKDSPYVVVIGAGGVAGTSGVVNTETNRGGNGGQSSFHSLTASGGLGGVRNARSSDTLPDSSTVAFLGQGGGVNSYPSTYNVLAVGGSGGGAGYGRGGNGASVGLKNTVTAPATPGTQGAVIIEYYDPDKEDA